MNSIPEGLMRTPEGIYVLKDDSHLSRWIEEHKRLDVADLELAKFRKYIPTDGTVIDAGASLGDHTLTYAKFVGPSGNVFSFEPNPLSYKALELNVKPWTNIHVRNQALSDSYHYCDLHPEPNVGASYLKSGDGKIECVELDIYMRLMDRCDFLHLDCEGSELPAMKGGAQLIGKFRPVMLLEIAQWVLERNGLCEADVTNYLASIGYRWEEAEPGCSAEKNPQRDILCLPLSQ
jgi:FkbM family methyltransferase